MRSTLAWFVIAGTLAACGGDDAGGIDASPRDAAPLDASSDILTQLQQLPGVTAVELTPEHAPAGYRYFQLEVTQPVDHTVTGGQTFQQEVSLIHRDVTAPMVLLTTGYDDYNRDYAAEPTMLISGNQISVEHRYFGTSRPDPADWSKLTIEQMADDEHAIVQLLKPIYQGAWISTGASKGGMTATYHRRFFPDDVAGTIAYVAPLSLSIPDQRYAPVLAADGTEPCADDVRAVAIEMLQNRRDALVARATAQATAQGYVYGRIAVGPAVEASIEDMEWSYWQYAGVDACGLVPPTTATDDELFNFLDQVSFVSFDDDDVIAEFEAYFYQAYAQIGSPGTTAIRGDLTDPNLLPYAMYSDADSTGWLPVGVAQPTFDPTAMQDIQSWIASAGSHFVFVYGEFDPWSGGRYDIGNATDTIEVTAAQGTHGSDLSTLAPSDRDQAYAMLAAWTGVTPNAAKASVRVRMPPHRVPM